MKNIEIMQRLQSNDSLDEHTPNLTLLKEFLLFFMLYDLLVEIAVIRELHNNAMINAKSTINFFPRGRLPYSR